MSAAPFLWSISSGSGAVRRIDWPAGGLGSLTPRLVAVWLVVGGGLHYVVRAGGGPWPGPEPGQVSGPERWAREDASRFNGRLRYRIVTRNPWMTIDQGFLAAEQIGLDLSRG